MNSLSSKTTYKRIHHVDIGKIVRTAGTLDLDLERANPYNYSQQRILPTGMPFILKNIDHGDYAYVYRTDTGVVKLPADLFVPD